MSNNSCIPIPSNPLTISDSNFRDDQFIARFLFNKQINASQFNINDAVLSLTEGDNFTPISFTINDKGLESDKMTLWFKIKVNGISSLDDGIMKLKFLKPQEVSKHNNA